MDDDRVEIAALEMNALASLRDLVRRMRANEVPWGTWRGGEEVRPGVMEMPWVEISGLCYEALTWLYDHERIFPFDWGSWDEGRAIFTNCTPETPDSLDHLTTRKLLTASARNDRFFDGAWVNMFEDGIGVPFFARLLELEEQLAAGR